MQPDAKAFVTDYALSRRSYYADFLTMPVATSVAVIWLLTLHNFNPFVFFSAVLAGMIGWTFIEYSVHRWGFHGSFQRNDHTFHHMNPDDFLGVSPMTTAMIGAFAFWFLTTVFGALMGVGLLVGLVVAYLFYLYVHDKFHHKNVRAGTYIARINALHEWHHRRFRVNFGVTSPAWDFIFGTYQRNPVRPSNER